MKRLLLIALLLLAAFIGWHWPHWLGVEMEIYDCYDMDGCWDYCAEKCLDDPCMSPSLEKIHADSIRCQESYERCGKPDEE